MGTYNGTSPTICFHWDHETNPSFHIEVVCGKTNLGFNKLTF